MDRGRYMQLSHKNAHYRFPYPKEYRDKGIARGTAAKQAAEAAPTRDAVLNCIGATNDHASRKCVTETMDGAHRVVPGRCRSASHSCGNDQLSSSSGNAHGSCLEAWEGEQRCPSLHTHCSFRYTYHFGVVCAAATMIRVLLATAWRVLAIAVL